MKCEWAVLNLFTMSLKLKMVECAKEDGYKATGRKLCINEKFMKGQKHRMTLLMKTASW
jgi:hypothetical protein